MGKINGYSLSFYSGLVALLLGLVLTLQMLAPFLDKAPSSFSPSLVGKFSLVLAECLSVLIFLMLAESFKNRPTYLHRVIAGGLKLALWVGMLILYWDTGWEYILDPDGAFLLAYPFLLMGILQGIGFLLPTFRSQTH